MNALYKLEPFRDFIFEDLDTEQFQELVRLVDPVNYVNRFKSRPAWNYAGNSDELTTFLILDGNSEWVQADQSLIYKKFMPADRTYYRILLDGRLTENAFINTFLTFYYSAFESLPVL